MWPKHLPTYNPTTARTYTKNSYFSFKFLNVQINYNTIRDALCADLVKAQQATRNDVSNGLDNIVSSDQLDN